MRAIRAILAFIRNQEWVDEPKWEEEDEKAWTAFLGTPTRRRISLILLNLTLRQNSSAVMKEGQKLAEACGYAKGCSEAGCVISNFCDISTLFVQSTFAPAFIQS